MVSPRHNQILEQLPSAELDLFIPHLELISVTKGQALVETGEVPHHVYFPVGAVVSMQCELEDGFCVETALVNKNHVVGMANYGNPSFYRAEVRTSGLAYRMPLDAFLLMRKTCHVFNDQLREANLRALRHLHFSVACSKRHNVTQQLVRWMLMIMDRTESPTIFSTHAELSTCVGFRREAITLTLGKLAMEGCISMSRGEIQVLDRAQLEAQTCECYWLAQGKKRPGFTALLDS
jgi:CRP-like cAMP-binding protein